MESKTSITFLTRMEFSKLFQVDLDDLDDPDRYKGYKDMYNCVIWLQVPYSVRNVVELQALLRMARSSRYTWNILLNSFQVRKVMLDLLSKGNLVGVAAQFK